MTRTVRIKNCTSRTFFVRYTIDGEITTKEIGAGETEKIDIDKGDEELIHIKHCDRYGSLVRICEAPVHKATFRRGIGPMFYVNFDCVVDVKDYYALLEVKEHYLERYYCIIPFFTTNDDSVKEYYFADEKDKRIVTGFYSMLYLFFMCCCALIVLLWAVAPLVDEKWTIEFTLFCFALGVLPFIYLLKAFKKFKRFKKCDMEYILEGGNYIYLLSKTDKHIKFEYILDAVDEEMRRWPFK